ncbi:MAG: hypothetical protein JO165_02800, partial [Candidatus Eremiobacteraeota bacterium]|nr:hypothetical protein [Candidatus Eremiobacteraeota bacterium]
MRGYLRRAEPHAIYLNGHTDLSEPLRALHGTTARKSETIVLEDADAAFCNPSSSRAITDAIFSLTHCRWILIARDPSPLPLEAWLAGRICDEPVDETDLRFDRAEAALIAQRFGSPAEDVGSLLQSGGNPLEFCALCSAPSYREAVLRVWECASRAAREELALLSVMPRGASAGDLARDLRETLNDGIVLGTDAAGNVQLHESAALVLREEFSPAQLEAVRQNAAECCALERRYEYVPELLKACGDTAVRDFLERFGFDMIEQGWTEEVFAFLARARTCEDRTSPLILALHALCESSFGRRDLASSWFSKAREAAHGTDAEP